MSATTHPLDTRGDGLTEAVLVRFAAIGPEWVLDLPVVPGHWTLTARVGHPDLVPVPVHELVGRGYRIVEVADAGGAVGHLVDVMVPLQLVDSAPAWWAGVCETADRVFDLRMGPVRTVLADEIAPHLRHRDAGS